MKREYIKYRMTSKGGNFLITYNLKDNNGILKWLNSDRKNRLFPVFPHYNIGMN